MRLGTVLRVAVCLAVLALAAAPGSAVAQSSTGTLGGTAVDQDGAPLPGVSIAVRNLDTSAARSSVTNAAGVFTLPLLPSGRYEVTATLSGFAESKLASVEVPVGSDISVKMTMRLSASAEVVVTSEAPLVETTRSQVSATVGERLVANLPTNGRNFIDFVLTTPGVTKDSSRTGDISFAGQRGTLNSLVVDGADNNNNFFGQTIGRTGSGRAPYQFSQDAVKEFQVNSNAYSAEYGRAGGAVVNVVTKSGTNELHGTAFEFYRDKGLNANDYINVINGRPKGAYHFHQFGASLGGPILRDKLFFFANYDGQRNTLGQPVVLNTAAVPADADSQAGLQKLLALADAYDRGQDQDVFLLKTDAEMGEHRLSLRWNRQRFTGNNNESGGPTIAEEHSGNSLVNTDTVSASFSSIFGSSFFNEVRAQYGKDEEPGTANSDRPEATVRNAGQTFLVIGQNFFSPRETTISKYQIADTATLLFGNHTVKAGFDYNRDVIFNFFPGNFAGVYNFNSIAGFNRGQPSATGESYLQAFAGPGTSGPVTNPDNTEIGLFAQDEWRFSTNFTLNGGVRYDYQRLKQPPTRNPNAQLAAAGIDTSYIPQDKDNVGARLGFAWTPGTSARTVVRGGYGMFYGRTPAIMVGTAHSNNGINVQTYRLTGAATPTYPNRLATIPAAGSQPVTIFIFDRDFQSPLVHQASLGAEHGLSDYFSIGATAIYVRGTHLQRSHDINLLDPVPTQIPDDQGNTFTVNRYPAARRFSNFARVIQFESSADSKYTGVTLDIQKRYRNHWQARLAYTLGKVSDTKPDATAVVPGGSDDAKYVSDPSNFDADYGPGIADARHRVVLSGIWNLDYFEGGGFLDRYVLGGWSISGIFTVQSGQPFTPVVTNDLNNDGNTRNDRAPLFGRNSFNYPLFVSFDPRITKEIPFGDTVRLQLIAEAFNLFNRSNVTNNPAGGAVGVRDAYYTYVAATNRLTTNANFGQPLSSAGPRIVQLAAKIIF
jgi:outer membrane receptor protein involved in Fe transport